MKFDFIIQNPPFANKLHEKFLMKCLDISERGVSIQPAVWINKANRYRKSFKNIIEKCNGRIKEINIIPHKEMNDYFRTVNIQEGGIFVWDIKGDLDLNKFGYNNELEQSLFEKTNIDLNEEMGLIRKGSHKYVNGKEYEVKDNEVPVYQWHRGDNCYDAVIVPKELWKKKTTLLLLTFNTKEEADNFRTSLKTKFADWFFYNYVVHGDYKIITYMYRMKDYTKPWTDERFYKHFNLTKEEIDIIEKIDKK